MFVCVSIRSLWITQHPRITHILDYLMRSRNKGKSNEKMSAWDKQDWIKDILSKSGTEITEINEVKTEG